MAFTPKTWANDQAGATPIVAAELNRMEQGIADTHGLNATLSNATLSTETIVAQFLLPAGYFAAGTMSNLRFLGQVSSTATLTYRVRIGTSGLVTDALCVQFAASGAGAANAHTSADTLLTALTAGATGTVAGGGQCQVVNAVIGPSTGVYTPATVNTTVAQRVSLTVVQSVVQTLTSRAGVLTRLS